MKNRMIERLAAAALALWALPHPACAEVTVDNLLDDMTDLKRLAMLPAPPYTTRQFSSWDRKSKTPGNDDWFANEDAGQFLRVEDKAGRKEHVMMDTPGPGVIVRMWATENTELDGTIRIYLDESDTPVIETPVKKLLGGAYPGLPRPIAGEYARGWNLYFPIPYAGRCKVTSDKPGFYYHVNYRTYAPGTPVKTFVPADLDRLAPCIQRIASQLEALPFDPDDQGTRVPLVGQVGKGEEVSADIDGPKAITRIHVQAPGVPPESEAAMARALIVKMAFDGENTVECPLADFFGTTPGFARYKSLPLRVAGEGKTMLDCEWFMPFARHARISVHNLSFQPVGILAEIQVTPYEWTDRSLLFHAKWRTGKDIPSRPFIDWTHLECTGAGRFVGGTLHIINPAKPWWGEGDEKIYVDGETFPSTFGTGTEDYYGYAWGSAKLFSHAYHNQTRCDGPGNFGNTSLNRFHVLDDIAFTRSFKFDMENWALSDKTKLTRAAASFWYARPGSTDFFKPITPEDVQPIEIKP